MASVTIPIKINFANVVLDCLRRMEIDEDDESYKKGFYDCRDGMISAMEKFLAEHDDI